MQTYFQKEIHFAKQLEEMMASDAAKETVPLIVPRVLTSSPDTDKELFHLTRYIKVLFVQNFFLNKLEFKRFSRI